MGGLPGVIFDIRPIVKEGIIDLDITQQLSNFVKATTGMNNSLTLTKRELKAKVGVQTVVDQICEEMIELGEPSPTYKY